jgi:uncharacterized delta-60 repeat protein
LLSASLPGSLSRDIAAAVGQDQSSSNFVFDAAGDIFAAVDNSVIEVARGSTSLTTLATFAKTYSTSITIDSSGNIFGLLDFFSGSNPSVFELARGGSTITTLESFNSSVYSPDSLVIDAAGNLYGTDEGTNNGSVFELARGSGAITDLATFNDPGAAIDMEGLSIDASGNLFGTAQDGSNSFVYEVASGTHASTRLASLTNVGVDGGSPTIDSADNLYFASSGSTPALYELKHGSNSATLLASFPPTLGYPFGDLIIDSAGDLIGSSSGGIFDLSTGGSTIETLGIGSLYGVQGLVLDSTGSLYLAILAGDYSAQAQFEPIPITPSPVPTTGFNSNVTIYDFGQSAQVNVTGVDAAGDVYGLESPNNSSGLSNFELPAGSSAVATPSALESFDQDFVVDAAGNLYAVSSSGTSTRAGFLPTSSSIEELPKGSSKVTTLATFDTSTDQAGFNLVVDMAGNIFGFGGTAGIGDSYSSDGNLFELPKGSGQITQLAAFADAGNLSFDNIQLTVDPEDDLYGVENNTSGGGSYTVFELLHGSSDITAVGPSTSQVPAGLAVDAQGDLFGSEPGTDAGGTIFEVARGSTSMRTIAALPQYQAYEMVTDASGDLFGATSSTLFELPKGSGTVQTLYVFTGTSGPNSLFIDAAGDLYGNTQTTIFRLPSQSLAVSAAVAAVDITSASSAETITVAYTDPAGLNLATIKPAGLIVTTELGSELDVTGVTLSAATGSPTSVTAAYTVAAPGGQWQAADNGVYTASLNFGQVLDTNGRTTLPASASFTVNLPPPNADPDFAAGGSVSVGFTTQASAVQPDGKVLLAGFESAGADTEAVLERLNADGSIDTTFGTGGTIVDASTSDEAYESVAVESNGDILVGGTSAGSLLVARYTAEGSPDGTFGNGGRAVTAVGGTTDATAHGLALGPTDDSIVVAGSAGGQFLVDRFITAGAADPTFNTGLPLLFGIGSDGDVLGQVAVQSNGDIVAAGASAGSVIVARVTAAGALDTTFGAGGIVTLSQLAAPDLVPGQPDHTEGLALDAAGNILVANHTTAGHFGAVRLTPTGAPDPTFGANGLVNTDFGGADDADSIAIDSSRVLVSGTTTTAGITEIAIAAYTSSGALDTTYVDGGKEVFATGLATGGIVPSVKHGGLPLPNAVNAASVEQQVAAALDPSGSHLVVGASQQGGSGGSAFRRLNLSSATATVPFTTGTLASTVAASLPKAAVGGAKVKQSVVVTVSNPTTTALSGPVTVTLYVSPYQSSLTDATQLSVTTKSLKLKPRQRAALKLTLSSFPDVPNGTYYLVASVKAADGTVTDVAGPSLSIAAPFVKAVVSDVKPVPASAAPGKPAGLELTLTNGGNIAASGTALLTISATAMASGALPTVVGTAPFKVKLKPGARRVYKVKFTPPASLAAGGYNVTASLNVSALGDPNATDGVSNAATPLIVT